MNSPLPASGPAQRRNWTRRLVNLLVALVVVAVAAATFVFSYDGVHAIALIGGMSDQLARYYPGLFDAVLVIACVAAVMLRDGRWWARLWAWVVVIVILAAIGTTDVLHAMAFTLRHRVTEGVVAAAPVVAVLLAFSLLLTLLRQSRTQAVEAAGPAPLDLPALPAAVSAPPIALPAAPVALVAPATVPAEAMPAAEDRPAPDVMPVPEVRPAAEVAPTRADPVIAEAPQAPQGEAPRVAAAESATPESAHAATKPNAVLADASPESPDSPAPESSSPESPAHPGTEPNEVIAPAAAPEPASPESAAAQAPPPEAAAVRGEFAPPTVQVPAMTTEPEAPPARGPHGLRYAGSGVPGMAGKQQAAGDDEPPNPEYWDAGLVYPAREVRADLDDTGDRDDAGDFDGPEASRADGVNDTEADEAAPRKVPPELDDDAPPFATAPFASVPRLNRVRSMPAPPADEDDSPGSA
jgi:hypothetical protein